MHFHLSIFLLIDGLLNEVWSSEIEGSKLNFNYWNSNLGNMHATEIKFGEESSILENWINDLPLKVITHGWLASEKIDLGLFEIRKAYIKKGGYNVITVDWSFYGVNIYSKSSKLTISVGSIIAEFLDRLVKVTGINPSNIHLIGHSLGAHVVGSCGAHFKSGKIGRITGLDPAGPYFETFGKLNRLLSKDDAEFVDVIHTSHILGLTNPIGHADFYPNNGESPQPGCRLIPKIGNMGENTCSHSMAYVYYTISIKDEMSAMATKCDSWDHYISNKCSNNIKIPMGHKTNSSARGNFYIETSILYNIKISKQYINDLKDNINFLSNKIKIFK